MKEGFNSIENKKIEPAILRHHDSSKVLKVACDASRPALGSILSQEGHPIML